MRRAECPFRRGGDGRDYRENEFVKPDLVRTYARSIKVSLNANPTREESLKGAFNYVSTVKYKEDLRHFGDVWKFPDATLRTREGDCEDTSIALISLLLTPELNIDGNHIRMVVGEVPEKRTKGLPRGIGGRIDGIPRQRAGHAWVEVQIGTEWYYLESTTNQTFEEWGWQIIRPQSFKVNHFINKDGCWYE